MRKERTLFLARNHFVAEVSHELRTPLTQIRMFTEMLLYNRVREESEVNQYLKLIDKESRRLGHLVANVLQFSKDDTKPTIFLKSHEIHSIIADALVEYSLSVNTKQIEFTNQLSAVCALTDQPCLQRVLINVLDNAIKYGPKQQTIQTTLIGDGDYWTVRIADQGIGLTDKEKRSAWFEDAEKSGCVFVMKFPVMPKLDK